MQIEKIVKYRVGDNVFDTELEAKRDLAKQFIDDLVTIITCETDAYDAVARALTRLIDMKGLSRQKLQTFVTLITDEVEDGEWKEKNVSVS